MMGFIMNMSRVLGVLIAVKIAAGMMACGGIGGAATSGDGGTDAGGNGIQLSGGVSIPSSDLAGGVSIPSADRKFRMLTPQGAKTLFAITSDQNLAPDSTVELLNADGTVVATTTTDDSGNYTFEDVDIDDLVDSTDAEDCTFYVRTTTTGDDGQEIVQIMAESMPKEDLENDTDGAVADLDVDYSSTAQTLLMFEDAGVNPLTEDSFPADTVNADDVDHLYDAVVGGALNLINEDDAVAGLTGKTMDDAMTSMLLACFALTGDSAGDMSPAEAMYQLITADDESETMDTLGTAIQAEDDFSDYAQLTLEGSSIAFDQLDDIVDNVWSGDANIATLLDEDEALFQMFIGSMMAGKTPSEFSAFNANSTILSYGYSLMGNVNLNALLANNSLDDLMENFGVFFDPELILALSDPNILAAVQGSIASLFNTDGSINSQLIKVSVAVLEDKASDAAWWDSFVSDGTVDTTLLGNFLEYFETGIAGGDYDTYFAGEKMYDWDEMCDLADFTMDWGSYDYATYSSYASTWQTQTAEDVVADSCQNFCGTMNRLSYCWCDDACTYYNDCCSDKTEQCGENYQYTALNSYGYSGDDIEVAYYGYDTEYDYDYDGIDFAVDNCPYDYNPAQTDTDLNSVGDDCEDVDGDWVYTVYDNCPDVYNWDQSDTDYDGTGDECDTDDDDDLVLDAADNCQYVANPTQTDADFNGIGDTCEGSDWDGDGFPDSMDNCMYYDNPTQIDTDADGTGDTCDFDSATTTTTTTTTDTSSTNSNCNYYADYDCDGVNDAYDNCVYDSNPTQINSDGDYDGDTCDWCPNNSFYYCGDTYCAYYVATYYYDDYYYPNYDGDADLDGTYNACDSDYVTSAFY